MIPVLETSPIFTARRHNDEVYLVDSLHEITEVVVRNGVVGVGLERGPETFLFVGVFFDGSLRKSRNGRKTDDEATDERGSIQSDFNIG